MAVSTEETVDVENAHPPTDVEGCRRRPPTPDFSILTAQERKQIASVLQRLKNEEEKDIERLRSAQMDMEREYATPDSADSEYVDLGEQFEVCESCNKPTTCHATQQVNSEETIFMCSACMKKRERLARTGRWYNGVDMDEILNTSILLLEKVMVIDAPREPSPQNERPPSPRQVAAPLPIVPVVKDPPPKEPKVESPVSPKPADTTVGAAFSTDRESPEAQGKDEAGSDKAAALPGMVATPMLVAMAADAAATKERKDSSAQSGGGAGQVDATSPMSEANESPELEDDAAAGFQDLGPGQVITDTASFEEIGQLELMLHLGADGPTKVGLIIDIKRAVNITRWASVGSKPGFSVYVKCYLMFPNMPEKSVKMKTALVPPGPDPKFDDQLIPVMSNAMMQKVKYLRVQLWEHNGKLRKNTAVGTVTIDIQSLELEEKGPVGGLYTMLKPGKHSVGVASPYASLRPSRQTTDTNLATANLSTQVDPNELSDRLKGV